MGFMNLEKAKQKYTEGLMQTCVQYLIDFDIYHCLRAGGMSAAMRAQKVLLHMPKQYEEWLMLCDGGLLFDTVLLSTKEKDESIDPDISFDTYEELNTPEQLEAFGLPEGYRVFAVRSYGDPLCFNVSADPTERTDHVYLWNVETAEFEEIWTTFADWLAEDTLDAIELVQEGVFKPLGIKQGGGEA